MKTTYEFTSPDGKPVFCRFTGLVHRPRGAEAGHMLVFDDGRRELTFVDGATKLPVAGTVLLASDLDLQTAKEWIDAAVTAKRLAQVDPATTAKRPTRAKADPPKQSDQTKNPEPTKDASPKEPEPSQEAPPTPSNEAAKQTSAPPPPPPPEK